jgi:pimeloyl-ACP methyl ester carboxylesterase
MAKRQLIIIPGLGDRGGLYKFFVPLWSLFGYQVHIFVFGWENPNVGFAVALKRLIAYIDNLDVQECYVIGVSAGGTAAINALVARPSAIAKVVTVCTPYFPMPKLGNNLLNTSLNNLKIVLPRVETNTSSRVLSVRGIYDGVIPAAKNKPHGIVHKTLFSFGHGATIYSALTIYNPIIDIFLKAK